MNGESIAISFSRTVKGVLQEKGSCVCKRGGDWRGLERDNLEGTGEPSNRRQPLCGTYEGLKGTSAGGQEDCLVRCRG